MILQVLSILQKSCSARSFLNNSLDETKRLSYRFCSTCDKLWRCHTGNLITRFSAVSSWKIYTRASILFSSSMFPYQFARSPDKVVLKFLADELFFPNISFRAYFIFTDLELWYWLQTTNSIPSNSILKIAHTSKYSL